MHFHTFLLVEELLTSISLPASHHGGMMVGAAAVTSGLRLKVLTEADRARALHKRVTRTTPDWTVYL